MTRHDGKSARKGTPIADRLAMHMRKVSSGCWEWTAYIDKSTGYGRMYVDHKCRYAHRMAFETWTGPIPAGLEIDHLCRNRKCINPAHLEAVTSQVNVRRGQSTGAKALRRDQCLRGHLYAEHGVMCVGRRICGLCRITYMRLYKEVPYEEVMRRKADGVPVVDLDAYFAAQRQVAA